MTFDKNLQAVSDFDVIEFARNIMSEVDSLRSFEFEQADDNTEKKEHKPIESRLNAFFRLIGLPMFVHMEKKDKNNKKSGDLSGERILTPGFYGSKLSDYEINDTDKDGISSDLFIREGNLLNIESSIGTPEMDERMSLALYKAIELAPDVTEDITRDVYKKLFPLITSYMEITPVKNETARPFLQYTKDQMPDSQTTLYKSFIETVIRIRYVSGANAENSAGTQKYTDITEQLQKKLGDTLYSTISKSTTNVFSGANADGVLENLILRKLIMAIPQLANKWYNLQKVQEGLGQRSGYVVSVKTSSSQSNAFGKRTDSNASISVVDSQYGWKLQILQKKLAVDEAMQMLLPSDDTISGTDKTGVTKNTVFMSLVAPFTKLLMPDYDETKSEIARIEGLIQQETQRMEKLRLQLEMMTGEFTGLSVIDVIAVIIALFAINKQDLIFMLDNDTKTEMKKDKVLAEALSSITFLNEVDDAKEAVTQLETTVKWVYDLLNAFIKSNANKSERSKNVQTLTDANGPENPDDIALMPLDTSSTTGG